MSDSNYFEFYGLPISFFTDEKALRTLFLTKSREFHPDFYTLESEEKQAEILRLSTYNNQAYKVLSNFDRRMRYVLDLLGALPAEGEAKLPQAFLMEMMEVNEQLMELEFDYDEVAFQKIKSEISTLESEQLKGIEPVLKGLDTINPDPRELFLIKEYYLKKRYLLRIIENLNKFASQ